MAHDAIVMRSFVAAVGDPKMGTLASVNVHFTYLIGISEKRHQKAGISRIRGQ